MSDIPPRNNYLEKHTTSLNYPIKPNGDRDFSFEAMYAIFEMEKVRLIGSYKEVTSNTELTFYCRGYDAKNGNPCCMIKVSKLFWAIYIKRIFDCASCVLWNRLKENGEIGEEMPETWPYGFSFISLKLAGKLAGIIIDYTKYENIDVTRRTTIKFKCKDCLKIVSKTFGALVKNKIFCCNLCQKAKNRPKINFNHELLNKMRDEEDLTFKDKKNYSEYRINREFPLEIKCKGKECEEWVKKSFRSFYEYRIFFCESCFLSSKNYICYDRKLLNKMLIENKATLAEEPEDELTRDSELKIRCKNEKCKTIVIKTFCRFYQGKIFYCEPCDSASKRELTLIQNRIQLDELFEKHKVDYAVTPSSKIDINDKVTIKCQGNSCSSLVTKAMKTFCKNKIFLCELCYLISVGQLRCDRNLLDQFLLELGLILAEDPGKILNSHTKISIFCRTNGCNKVITKGFHVWMTSKILTCDVCYNVKPDCNDVKCDTNLYNTFIDCYNVLPINRFDEYSSNKLMIGRCILLDCKKYYFRPSIELFSEEMPYCDECSFIIKRNRTCKKKYNIEAIKGVFLKHGMDDFLISVIKKEEPNINTLYTYDCKTETCFEECRRTSRCIIETENMYCNKCTTKNREPVIFNKELYDTIIPVLYPNIPITTHSGTYNEDSLFYIGCQSSSCETLMIKSFRWLLESPEIYCKRHANEDCYYDRKLRFFVGKTRVKLDRQYKGVRREDYISGHCISKNCLGKFNKCIFDLLDCMNPYCKKCTKKVALEKAIKTVIARYGVSHVMFDPEILERCIKNAYKKKEYILPDGAVVLVQGYEPHAIDLLFALGYKQHELMIGTSAVPTIPYIFEGTRREYHSDIYIPNENRLIEVKSIWTYMLQFDKNWAKRDASVAAGYNFEFQIFDDKGNLLEVIKERC